MDNTWISVKDRLPADYARVLFYDSSVLGVAYGYHVASVPQWQMDGGLMYYHKKEYDRITHWMPLPEPPEIED